MTDLVSGQKYQVKFVCAKFDEISGLGKVVDFAGKKMFVANNSTRYKLV